MIVARLTDGTFLVGICDENVARMRAGKPLQVNLEAMGGTDKVVVFHGPTMEDVEHQLRTVAGGNLPPPGDMPADANRC